MCLEDDLQQLRASQMLFLLRTRMDWRSSITSADGTRKLEHMYSDTHRTMDKEQKGRAVV